MADREVNYKLTVSGGQAQEGMRSTSRELRKLERDYERTTTASEKLKKQEETFDRALRSGADPQQIAALRGNARRQAFMQSEGGQALQAIPGVGGLVSTGARGGPVLLAMAALTFSLKTLKSSIDRSMDRGDRAAALGLPAEDIRRAEAIGGRLGVRARDIPVEQLAQRGLGSGRTVSQQLLQELRMLEGISDPRQRSAVARGIGGPGLARMATLQEQRGISAAELGDVRAGQRLFGFEQFGPFRRQAGQRINERLEDPAVFARPLLGSLVGIIAEGVGVALRKTQSGETEGAAFGEAQ